MYTLKLNNNTNNWDLLDSNGNVEINNIPSDFDAKQILKEFNNNI